MSGFAAMYEASKQAKLLASEFGGLLPGETVGDLFCGAGGWTALASSLGIEVDWAVNHDPTAIEYHERNYPQCRHSQGDAWHVAPRDAAGDAPVGLLLASAACTTHSRARGSAPVSPRVHMLGWCIARYAKDLRPRVLLIENVVEWKDWGPTVAKVGEDGQPMRDAQGRPIQVHDPKKRGSEFRKWWRYMQRLGYVLESRVLEASSFGAASRRKRLFVVARRDGQPIRWPEEPGTGGKVAADVIDWSDLGTSIFSRPRPLADKTLRRIAEGIRRYVLADAAPFTVRVTHGEGRGWAVAPTDGPLATQTTRQDLAVVTPVVGVCAHGDQSGGQVRWGRGALPVSDPLNTIHAGGNNFAVISPVVAPCGGPKREPSAVDRILHTVLTREDRGIVVPVLATTGYSERDGQAPRVHPVSDKLTTAVDGVKQAIASPVLMTNTSGHTGGKVGRPVPTITTGGHHGVACPVLSEYYGNSTGGRRVDEQLGAVVTHDRHGVGTPVCVSLRNNCDGESVTEPVGTITSGGTHHGLATPVCGPCGQVERARQVAELLVRLLGKHAVELNEDGLVVVRIAGEAMVMVDILFRMLKPRELADAMGFGPGFVLPKVQRHAVRLIGNAVSPVVGRELIAANFPAGRLRHHQRAAGGAA